MIEKIVTSATSGLAYTRRHPQLLGTVLLLVIIPLAFLVSGQQFLSAARENQERLEKDRIGLFHDMFAAYMRGVAFDATSIQGEIDRIADLNIDFTRFRIAHEEGNTIRIIAALDHESLDTVVGGEEADMYRFANTHLTDSILSPIAREGVRYWQGFRLVRDDLGSDYYIFTETSLAHIDQLFAHRIMIAYYWLIGLLSIIVYLLIRHVRLIDYAYLYRETKKANEMKDLFTNMIAHELRAPLTAIRGYASMIRESDTVDLTTRSHATHIEESAGRLVHIISDLLDVARIQSGKLSISKERVELTNLAASVMDALRPIAEEKKISLTFERPTREVSIIGDEKRLYQALMNVINNSIKYTERGSIALSIEKRSDRVELRVKDTGMGISSNDQKGLFAPFFRVSSEETNTITGTGLGMWITKQIVELMGASIGVESIKGVGTHVVITFPVR